MAQVHRHCVRYHEVDGQGYLFNARYLEITDVAMTEFFRGLGWTYPQLVAGGTDPSVVSARLTFRRPARFDDEIEVDVTCPRIGDSSFDLAMVLSRGGEELATVELVYVNVDAGGEMSVSLPAMVRDALRGSTRM